MKVSYKVLFAAILATAGAPAIAAETAVTGLATTNYVKGAIESLDSSVATSNGAVDTITETNGKITATHKLLKNKDIADDAAISVSKIDGAEVAAHRVQTVTKNSEGFITGLDSLENYPSMAAAKAIADERAAVAVSESTMDMNYAGAEGTGVIVDVIQENGAVSATRGLVTKDDLDDGIIVDGLNTTASRDDSGAYKVAVADGTTAAKGVVRLTDAVTANDSTKAVTGKAVTDAISGKADKATTLGGYGITDAYTKDVIGTGYNTTNTVQKAIADAKTAATNAVTASGSNGVTASASNGKVTVAGVDATASAKGVAKLTSTYSETSTDAAVTGKAVSSIIGTGYTTTNTVQKAIADAKTAATNAVTASGSNGVTASAANGKVTVAGINATASTKGVAEFHNAGSGKVVTSVAIADGVVTTTNGNLAATDLTGGCKEGDTNCALVNLGGTKQWLKIVDDYSASN